MSSKLSLTTLVVGLLVLAGFGLLCFYMIEVSASLPKDEQFRWDHLVVVFNSIQAMAAAALGVLLGTTVQQARVDAANSRAALSEEKRRANEKDGTKNAAIRRLLGETQPSARDSGAPDDTLKAVRAILDS